MSIPENLRKYVEAGEVIPLLCALAESSGDRSLLDDSFMPHLDAELITVPAHGGLSEMAVKAARERIAVTLEKLLENGDVGSKIPTQEIIQFMTAGSQEYAKLMQDEFGDEADWPTWQKSEIAPDRKFRVGIIGAGQSGLAMARELKRAGVDFVLYDRNEGAGGAWWQNTYPGCRLDTGRLAYSYSFAQRKDWSHFFTRQEDLVRYYNDFASDQGLNDHIEYNSQVLAAQFQQDDASWCLTIRDLASGAERSTTVDVLISAVGVLNQPKIPKITDDHRFKGETVHSAQWHSGIDVKGKRVSIIGTGASAYQIAPSIVDEVASLAIFQRSAPWMLPTPTYHDEVSSEALWLSDVLPTYHRWQRLWEFWHSTIGKYALTQADPDWREPGSVSEANQRFRASLEAHIRRQYEADDPLAERAIPAYPVGAKRMLRDNGVWARTLRSPHVSLVTDGIARFDKDGIVTNSDEHVPSDLIIYATGFNATDFLGTFEVRGRDGLLLSEFWGDEPRANLGITVPGFPNLFCIGGPNTSLVAIGSQTFIHESAVRYINQSIRALLEEGAACVEPTQEAYQQFARWVDEGNRKMAWGAAEVNSWYRNSRGVVTASWPYSLLTYWQITRDVDPGEVVYSGNVQVAMST
ncbi:flavin-containing monooxygenase [Sulfitobacter sp. EhC04]|uniref:flavin-containing monooxygenase n=1 Tax=Sulfitobacter sp. EhC04 TaxID=1849168 RepID=UPI00082DC5B8|nr:NAD(P)/FAD-dependent oxidoreductase [Sulfitobacter sp. EhC04]